MSYSFAFVEYASVEEAQAVYDQEETIVVDGSVLFKNFALHQRKCKVEHMHHSTKQILVVKEP